MPMIENNQKSREDGISSYEEEAVVEKTFEVKRKGLKSGYVFLDEVERSNIGHKGCEKHVDHEYYNHFCHHFVAKFRVSIVVGVLL